MRLSEELSVKMGLWRGGGREEELQAGGGAAL